MTEQVTEQQQSGQQGPPQPSYITREQLNEALANVGQQQQQQHGTRTHVVQGQQGQQQSGDDGGMKSLMDTINAQPERIVNAIREAFQAPKDDSKEQQAATQAKVEAKQDPTGSEPPPPKTRQQRFRDWWLES